MNPYLVHSCAAVKMVAQDSVSDPLGPRTFSSSEPPAVQRVKSVYGVNLPTEVGPCADGKVSYRQLEKPQHSMDWILHGCADYQIDDGIILETNPHNSDNKLSTMVLKPNVKSLC